MEESTLDDMLTSLTVETHNMRNRESGDLIADLNTANYVRPSNVSVTSYGHVSEASLSQLESTLSGKFGTYLSDYPFYSDFSTSTPTFQSD